MNEDGYIECYECDGRGCIIRYLSIDLIKIPMNSTCDICKGRKKIKWIENLLR